MKTSRRVAKLAIAGALMTVAVLGSGRAFAHTVDFASHVSITVCCATDGLWDFGGEVSSPKARCEPHRTVKLFRKRSGPDQLMDRDATNSEGAWHVEPNPSPAGTYYARVTRTDIGGPGHDHICDPARSPDLEVPAP
jgi:hypothetical protein